jgi:hypothetical protein
MIYLDLANLVREDKRAVEAKLKEGPDLSVSPLHLLPLGSTPLERDPETLWKDRLLIQVSNIFFILLFLRFITL